MEQKTKDSSYSLQRTYEQISEELSGNNYSIGTKLMPLRAMAKKYNVSYLTAQKAIKILQMQGALEAKPGDGIYVTGRPKKGSRDIRDFIQNMPGTGNNNHNITKNHSICVIMPFWASVRGSASIYTIIKGVLSESDKHNWRIELLHNSGDESDNEPSHPEFLKKIDDRNPDGVIWLQPVPTHKMNIMRLVDKGYEVVITGRNFKDLPVKSLNINTRDMAQKCLSYLSAKGSQNIAMLTGPVGGIYKDPYSVDIVDAFKEAMEQNNPDFSNEMLCQAGFSQQLESILMHFFSSNKKFDAIICLHEHILACIEKLENEGYIKLEKKIPLIDISGIFNFEVHRFKNFEIKQVQWPLEELGKAVINEFEKQWIKDHNPAEYKLEVQIPV